MSVKLVFLLICSVWCCAMTGKKIIFYVYTVNSGDIGPTLTTDILSHTVNMIDFGQIFSQIKSFEFEVKACNDVNVYLSSSLELDSSKPFYELVIGGYSGKATCIGRRDSDSMSQSSWYEAFPGCEETANEMDLPMCFELRPFWISWDSGHLNIGRGTSNMKDGFLNWTDPDPFPVKNMGISTSWGATGEWKIVIYDNFSGYYKGCAPVDSINNVKPMDTKNIGKFGCPVLCAFIDTCIGFNFKEQGNICELLSFSQDNKPSNPRTNISEWIFFSKCGQGPSGCIGC